MEKTDSEVFAFLKGRVSLAILKGTHNCIHSSRDNESTPSYFTTKKPICEDGNSLSLMLDFNEVSLSNTGTD